ncbi:DUF4386 domain-containing protein [Actinophytocola algeriensis]|uniref:DUF4386 domain-containing protein n=1 Tax=Actinophytocola algeriensis TaxID=1768010 RepID=A0A7W7Q793_9PSEU|nr:DUF4386 domain-containing protein [Actinophytocola algeriensis]MBB4908387.1 hypothetical protein [Actinophytocola algeriensis]MBE1475226.1 hypothetical protein [Actinophytocola algeriensis]
MTGPHAGRVAGIGLLAMSVLAGFANFGVVEQVVTPADAATPLFRAGVLALVLVVALDTLVALALREFFSPVDHALSTLTAWFRLVYAAVFLVAIAQLSAAVGEPDALARIEDFRGLWDLGLILFGGHLLLLGLLAYRSANVPTALAVLLAAAGLGYAVDGAGSVAGFSTGLATFTFVGEVLFMCWLLVKGGTAAARDDRRSLAGADRP